MQVEFLSKNFSKFDSLATYLVYYNTNVVWLDPKHAFLETL